MNGRETTREKTTWTFFALDTSWLAVHGMRPHLQHWQRGHHHHHHEDAALALRHHPPEAPRLALLEVGLVAATVVGLAADDRRVNNDRWKSCASIIS